MNSRNRLGLIYGLACMTFLVFAMTLKAEDTPITLVMPRANPISDIEQLENKLFFLQNEIWGNDSNIEIIKRRIEKLKLWQDRDEDQQFLNRLTTNYLEKGGDPLSLLKAYTTAVKTLDYVLEQLINMRNEELEQLERELSLYQEGIDKKQEQAKRVVDEILNSDSWRDIKAAYENKKKARERKTGNVKEQKSHVENVTYSATCIFISKEKENVEIGRKEWSASTEEELKSLLKQHCETDKFKVKITPISVK